MAGRGTDILLGGNPEVLAEDSLRRRATISTHARDDARDWSPRGGRRRLAEAEPRHDERALSARGAKETVRRGERAACVAAGGLAVIGTERHE